MKGINGYQGIRFSARSFILPEENRGELIITPRRRDVFGLDSFLDGPFKITRSKEGIECVDMPENQHPAFERILLRVNYYDLSEEVDGSKVYRTKNSKRKDYQYFSEEFMDLVCSREKVLRIQKVFTISPPEFGYPLANPLEN